MNQKLHKNSCDKIYLCKEERSKNKFKYFEQRGTMSKNTEMPQLQNRFLKLCTKSVD